MFFPISTTIRDFPIQQTPLEIAWEHAPQYLLLSHATKYLNNLHMYSITTITQIQNSTAQHTLSPQEFTIKFKASSKPIKEALQQAQILFLSPTQPIATTRTKVSSIHK